jgi:hypothetical protein
MVCEKCGAVRGVQSPGSPMSEQGSVGPECTCAADGDSLSLLLRLLTLLSNCGLSAGAPTVLKSRVRN